MNGQVVQPQKRWIAVTLSLFLNPLGMFYLGRPLLAVGYFVVTLLLAMLAMVQPGGSLQVALPAAALAMPIIAAIHAFFIAKDATGAAGRPWYSKWYGLGSIMIGYLTVAFAVRAFGVEPFSVPSWSMAPTLEAGASIIVKKPGYGHYGAYGIDVFRTAVSARVERGDVLVFRWPSDPGSSVVKRVVGVPGDHLEYREKQLRVNGVQVAVGVVEESEDKIFIRERLGNSEYVIVNTLSSPDKPFSVEVAANELFLMGDNRDNSADSRQHGALPFDYLVGKVIYGFSAGPSSGPPKIKTLQGKSE